MTLFAAAAREFFPSCTSADPWLFYWLFPYPDTMTAVAAIPQSVALGFLRASSPTSFPPSCSGISASFPIWRQFAIAPRRAGNKSFTARWRWASAARTRQWRHYHATYGVLAAIMAPLVVSVHSIVGLDFAGAATVGWHSTQFPPFFVFGALLSGFAMVLLLIVPLRHFLHLEDVITGRHFDVLCRMMLVSSLCLAYAYMMDAFTTFYGPDHGRQNDVHRQVDRVLFARSTGPPYSSTSLCRSLCGFRGCV